MENVVRTDESIAQFVDNPSTASAITKLFERWGWAESVRRSFLDLEQDLADVQERDSSTANSSYALVPSRKQRENCYHAFLGTLSYPHMSNKCRADSFDDYNEPFKNALLFSQDVSQFLKSAPQLVRISDMDSEHWKIMGAMTLRFPEEMERWTADRELPFELLERDGRFEIWQIVRLYINSLIGPYDGPSLLDMWTTPPHDSLGHKIWEEKQQEHKRVQTGLKRLLQQIREFKPTEIEGDADSLDDSTENEDEGEDNVYRAKREVR